MTTAAPSTVTMSELRSKALIGRYGIPLPPERVVRAGPAAGDGVVAALEELGPPVAVKLCGDGIAHKTERGLVRLGVRDPESARVAAVELLAAARPEDGEVGLLVAPMIPGRRELIAGLALDDQFGMTVLVGVGGILAEAIADVVVRLVPIEEVDAHDMLDSIATQAILGPFRGEPPVDRDAVVRVLMALSRLADENPDVVSVDLNPLIISDGAPVAVDALVETCVGPDTAIATSGGVGADR